MRFNFPFNLCSLFWKKNYILPELQWITFCGTCPITAVCLNLVWLTFGGAGGSCIEITSISGLVDSSWTGMSFAGAGAGSGSSSKVITSWKNNGF